MRITAGQWRGRNLVVPDTPGTRPTMDRTRQAVFNILRSAAWALDKGGSPLLIETSVLDVFAGSGAMGFEALSQGASKALFIDNAEIAYQAIQKNIQKIGIKDVARAIKNDPVKIPENKSSVFGLAFFDPPYHENLLAPALTALANKNYIDSETLLVLEMHKDEDIGSDLVEIFDTRQYGMSKIVFGRLKLST